MRSTNTHSTSTRSTDTRSTDTAQPADVPLAEPPAATTFPTASTIVMALLTIAPFFLWGTAMVAMKGVMPHTTPLFVAGFRLVPAGLLVLLAAAIAGLPQPRGWRAWGWIVAFAAIDAMLFQGFLAEGLERTVAGVGSVTIDSQPLIVATLSCLLLGERIGWLGWLGLAIGALGIAAIGLPLDWLLAKIGGSALPAEIPEELVFGVGEGLMLCAAFAMAVGTLMIPKVAERADPIVATGWHMVLGGLPLFALSAYLEVEPWQQLAPSEWLALGYSTVFGSAIAYGLFFYFAARQNLIGLSSLTFLTPVFALLFGYLFLAETLSFQQWAGVGLTLVGVFAIGQRDRVLPPDDAAPASACPESAAPGGSANEASGESCGEQGDESGSTTSGKPAG